MHAAMRPQEVNPAKLASLFGKQLELCRVKAGETIAIVIDHGRLVDPAMIVKREAR